MAARGPHEARPPPPSLPARRTRSRGQPGKADGGAPAGGSGAHLRAAVLLHHPRPLRERLGEAFPPRLGIVVGQRVGQARPQRRNLGQRIFGAKFLLGAALRSARAIRRGNGQKQRAEIRGERRQQAEGAGPADPAPASSSTAQRGWSRGASRARQAPAVLATAVSRNTGLEARGCLPSRPTPAPRRPGGTREAQTASTKAPPPPASRASSSNATPPDRFRTRRPRTVPARPRREERERPQRPSTWMSFGCAMAARPCFSCSCSSSSSYRETVKSSYTSGFTREM